MDDEQFFESILATESNYHFKPLKTIPYSTIHAVISFIISVLGAFLACVWQSDTDCEEYFLILYLRCIFWIVTFLYDHIIKYHHEKLRMNGYHEFYRATSLHKGVPLHTVSLWNTIILGIQTIMQHEYGSKFFDHCTKSFFSPTTYIVLFCAFETTLLIAVHAWYIIRVMRFNRATLPPDAYRGLAESMDSVGVATRDTEANDLLEKQADLINYLKDHNNKLNQKLMTLNAQIRASSGNIPQN
ncbi:transmembrane protein 192-like [Contarinia nasturtii]|uniref:transmembrane protein 192-like n=1 Tax=Contarinia nasturtii TaxID=265458 RepID=UPI0012D41F6A|nr:transmembrane protein 192-like [Contarinia nasturtii]